MKSTLDKIVREMLRSHGRDISQYDDAFLLKSLDKRLAITGLESIEAYGDFLPANSIEADHFFASLCIAYSRFFRDPLTFALLEQLILPSLISLKQKTGQKEIRIWSAGCAAGQEPYSVAILLNELTAERGGGVDFRLFATDHSDAELAEARRGIYDCSALQNVRLQHVRKYFALKGESYQICERLKERVDFSAYDLLDLHSGSPSASIYGDFDLVLCGNLLFYYRHDIRQLILNKIYRSLSPGGYLATGEAERDIVAKQGGFRTVASPAPIFKKSIHRGNQ